MSTAGDRAINKQVMRSGVPDWVEQAGLLAGDSSRGKVILGQAAKTDRIQSGGSLSGGDAVQGPMHPGGADQEPGCYQGALFNGLGTRELAEGWNDDALKDLETSLSRTKKCLDNAAPGEKAAIAEDLVQLDFNYANALIRHSVALTGPKVADKALTPSLLRRQILQDRRNADQVFASSLELAEKYNISPVEQSDVTRQKVGNEVFIAGQNNVRLREGVIAYKKQMRSANSELIHVLDRLKPDTSNDGLGAKALTLVMLAGTELLLSDSPTDPDAMQAEGHYKEAIKLWHEYKPADEQAEDVRAESLFVALKILKSLLLSQNKRQEGVALDAEMRAIVAKHPELKDKK